MSIIRFALIGAAVAYGINHITKKRADGTSILDEWTENAPEWFEKGKQHVNDTFNHMAETMKEHRNSPEPEQY